ncbi:MAG: O-methyltransferase [Solirubrobacterales bacterium]
MSADESASAAEAGSKFTALTSDLHGFLVEFGSREDEALEHVRESTDELGSVSAMQIAPEQGALLTLLARSIGARRAIEIGTFTGYSAICIARGLSADGELIACEASEEYAAIARRHFERAGVSEQIDLRIGAALETLRVLDDEPVFDLAFVDADKANYAAYYEECLARLRPGGLIALDNLFLGGRIIDPAADDESAVHMRALAEQLSDDERVDVAMIGVADGIALVRKR